MDVSCVLPLDVHSIALLGNGYICSRLGTYLCKVRDIFAKDTLGWRLG